MNRWILVMILSLVVVSVAGLVVFKSNRDDTYVVEHTEYQPPRQDDADVLADDRLEDKAQPPFDPKLVDRRPLGPGGKWLLNASPAVVRLDVLLIKPDREPQLLTLYPSYAAAAGNNPVLPSVNMLDGKAKQFDDGLYAALDRAYYKGLKDKLVSHVKLVRRLYDALGPENVAAPFLAAGLELAGVQVMSAAF